MYSRLVNIRLWESVTKFFSISLFSLNACGKMTYYNFTSLEFSRFWRRPSRHPEVGVPCSLFIIHHLILSSFATFSFNVLLFFCYPVQFWFSLIEFNLNLSLPNFVLLPYMFNYLLCLPPHLIVRTVCRLVQIRHNKSQRMYCMMI